MIPPLLVLLLLSQAISRDPTCFQQLKDTKWTNYNRLYQYLTGTGNHNFDESVTIGFLGAYGETKVGLGALPLAIQAVNSDPNLLPGRQLKFIAADIGTQNGRSSSLTTLPIRVMTVMRDSGTVAFIGPDGTCREEAVVAAAWNLPIISYRCADRLVSDKRVYHTFARTLPPSTKVSKSVVALLKAFDWNMFVIISGTMPAWAPQVKDAIKWLANKNNITVTDVYEFSNYIPKDIKKMDKLVADSFHRTRVYVFIGEHVALVDFVLCLQARKLLENGEYIVISVDDEIYNPAKKKNILLRAYIDPFIDTDANHTLAFRSVLKLTPSHPRNPKYNAISEEVRRISAQPPFCVPYHSKIFDSISVPITAAHLYDAVMIYARALTEVFAEGEDPRNGTAILKKILNRTYHSVQGHDVYIDSNGDAEGNFSVVALLDDMDDNGTKTMSMQPVGYFQYHENNTSLPEFKYFNESRKIQWIGGEVPLAEPVCGFNGRKCHSDRWRVIVILGGLASLSFIAALFAFKHYRYEQKLACLLWKIDMREVTIIPNGQGEKSMMLCSGQICRQSILRSIAPEVSPKRAYTNIGFYKGNTVAIKAVHKRSVDITRNIRKELKQIRELRHENIITFVGACVDAGNICIFTEYCARGSLEDVLANEDLHLDNMFVSSLVADIIKGMIYLHDSEIVSHGNLRSSNCLVDSRWVLQITDFGLHEFKAGQEEDDSLETRRKLWRAPELLKGAHCHPRGTQKGDVYSFAIILHEVVGRSGPWGSTQLTEQEIVKSVASGSGLRPDVSGLDTSPSIVKCMESCWDEDPENRPDFRFVRVKLKEMQAGLKPNIFDNMLAIMEKYASNLEGLVQERTNQLTEEKKKTDALLNRMLPKTVAESLKRGERVEAESFECVTIYFSDIVGFTELSAVSTPLQVVELLNDLYTCCDSIISHYDVYKVETIGDAYMVVSGLPVRNGDRHAGEIASMAIHMLASIKRLKISHQPGEPLKLRIGIHSGHCVAGVVGLKMPRYCLFGDTVNTASRMESTGEAFKIHISHTTKDLLDRLGGYTCEERGNIMIKGKGEMLTYWLVGEDTAMRMARIQDIDQSSLSSERLSETPDLLRRPIGNELLSDAGDVAAAKLLHQLHLRAVRAYKKHRSQEMLTISKHTPKVSGHRSEPVITFRDTSKP
ncbi:guanylate cyclase 32E isoform X1 [Cimex lectularius]|uniref:Guanylate cyclase n=1 Tax=Cimex lectularius TaxID=79782 RepID=A0A8I6STS6_CIMLE|nr:guanylate cyclase 32E isoform X1 [Cimex lectularius]XP_024085458.1 guanylate cyclase 32E isoform X1 [Cimex lectularius]